MTCRCILFKPLTYNLHDRKTKQYHFPENKHHNNYRKITGNSYKTQLNLLVHRKDNISHDWITIYTVHHTDERETMK